MFIANSSQDDLTLLGELIATGKLEPVIDRRYSLSEVPDAVRYVEEGHARGKVIVDFAPAHGFSTAARDCEARRAVIQ